MPEHADLYWPEYTTAAERKKVTLTVAVAGTDQTAMMIGCQH